MIVEALPLLLLIITFGALLLGFPVAFTLCGVSIGFALIAGLIGLFDTTLLLALGPRLWGVLTNELLLAIPLFILMGTVLDRSGIAADLLTTMADLMHRIPGGLGLSLCVVGALLAASTGIVGATVIAMGLISLPALLARGYPAPLASGLICATGSLGQIIPPSIVLVLLADQLGAVYGEAQRTVGNWTAQSVSVGDLFAGALIPGLLLVGAYALYVLAVCWFGRIDLDHVKRPPKTIATGRVTKALVAPLFLLMAVLGSILGGLATPTEAAGLGAAGAVLLAGSKAATARGRLIWLGILAIIVALVLRALADTRAAAMSQFIPPALAQPVMIVAAILFAAALIFAVAATLRAGVLAAALQQTLEISAMVYGILIGATCFALVFRGLEGDAVVGGFLTTLPGGEVGALAFVMLVIFVLGFFLDVIEIITLAVPILALSLLQTVDPLWFGVLVAVNLQTSYLTPPFGFALFYLRGVAPQTVRTIDMYRGVLPFTALQLIVLGVLLAAPGLVTALPQWLRG